MQKDHSTLLSLVANVMITAAMRRALRTGAGQCCTDETTPRAAIRACSGRNGRARRKARAKRPSEAPGFGRGAGCANRGAGGSRASRSSAASSVSSSSSSSSSSASSRSRPLVWRASISRRKDSTRSATRQLRDQADERAQYHAPPTASASGRRRGCSGALAGEPYVIGQGRALTAVDARAAAQPLHRRGAGARRARARAAARSARGAGRP